MAWTTTVDSEVGRTVADMPPECTIPAAGGEGVAMNTARVGLFSRRRDLDRNPVVQDGTRPRPVTVDAEDPL